MVKPHQQLSYEDCWALRSQRTSDGEWKRKKTVIIMPETDSSYSFYRDMIEIGCSNAHLICRKNIVEEGVNWVLSRTNLKK